MIQFEHLKFSDCKSMPWKNGKGPTKQIKIFPDDASIEKNDFIWRLSSAEVCESGPFSVFPNYQRILTVLEGQGLKLSYENNKEACFANIDSTKVIEFRGDDQIFCQLIGSKVLDLNFIYQRNQIKAEFGFMNSKIDKLEISCDTHIFFSITGCIQIHLNSTTIELNKYDTLIINKNISEAHSSMANISIFPQQDVSYIIIRLKKIS